jgi:phosphate starvation-inducible PhoH-like protein
MASVDIDLGSVERAAEFSGSLDKYLKAIEDGFDVKVTGRGQTIAVNGEEENVEMAVSACRQMLGVLSKNGSLDDQTVDYAIGMTKAGEEGSVSQLTGDCIMITAKGKPIRPKTLGQKKYVESIRKNSIVFGIGPAGTGKTYLSVVMAVSALKNKEVSRLILTRPAVEAGEKLGFLPGDLQTKIDPYLRPLYDALFDTMGPEVFQKNVERGIIEVAPLAYMRGRTLDDAFIILDEAQNTTGEQMKMFLTRLGNGSRMVVNGDITQIDLPDGKKSGLVEAIRILNDIDGIDIVRFSHRDIVRNKLVSAIVSAYEKKSGKERDNAKEGRRGKK